MDSGKNSDNDFSMDTKPPQSDIDPGRQGGNKNAACPPGQVPSCTSATAALPRAPIPLPRPMGQHGSWPRCSHVSRMGNEWWEWCMRVLEASDLQPVHHNCTECFIWTVQNVTDRTEFEAIPAFPLCSWNGHKHLKTG